MPIGVAQLVPRSVTFARFPGGATATAARVAAAVPARLVAAAAPSWSSADQTFGVIGAEGLGQVLSLNRLPSRYEPRRQVRGISRPNA